MFVSHIAELSDAHLYFPKFRKFLGALPPLEKSLATPLLRLIYNRVDIEAFYRVIIMYVITPIK